MQDLGDVEGEDPFQGIWELQNAAWVEPSLHEGRVCHYALVTPPDWK